jgi:hypothetical protein
VVAVRLAADTDAAVVVPSVVAPLVSDPTVACPVTESVPDETAPDPAFTPVAVTAPSEAEGTEMGVSNSKVVLFVVNVAVAEPVLICTEEPVTTRPRLEPNTTFPDSSVKGLVASLLRRTPKEVLVSSNLAFLNALTVRHVEVESRYSREFV